MPLVIIEPWSDEYGGYYTYDPTNFKQKPVICVVESDEKTMANVIAHEFRHHIQHMLNQHCTKPIALDFSLEYNTMITKYFRSSESEMDALLYSVKYAKTEVTDWWLNHLVKEHQNA
jgi:chromosomal replication initiation ATPase DnaA